MYKSKRNWRSRAIVLTLLCVACFLGAALHSGNGVHADSRRSKSETKTAVHVKSGAARSEAVLLEIAGTLKRIESRLERLEKIASAIEVAGRSDGSDTSER